MHHAREPRAPAGLHVRYGPHRGTSAGQAPQQSASHIANPLANQFLVGIVLAAGDVVGYQGGEQRVDGAQHRQGQREAPQGAQIPPSHLGPLQLR